MAFNKLLLQVVESYAHLLIEYQQVVNQVRDLVDVAVAVASGSLDNGLDSLLAYLLGNLIDTFGKQLGGVPIWWKSN